MPEHTSHEAFVTTRWTRVLEARGSSPAARAALSELCEAYYRPVRAFIRRGVGEEQAAADLTQEFFARLLTGGRIDGVDPTRGRFRSFLLGAVKHFLSDARARQHALKRGGGETHISVDAEDESAVSEISSQGPRPDAEFDRAWALAILDHALSALQVELHTAGRTQHFDTLKPWLTGDHSELSQADAARKLGLNEGAVKVAIHRLRRRFRELVKTEIAQTLADPADAEHELNCLVAALSAR